MKLLATCPECGYKLSCSEDGTRSEMACPKCGAVVHYEVQGSRITTEVVQRSDKVPRRIREYADKLK